MEELGVVAQTNIKPDFWRGRRVMVTGHTGFKGGWLAHWLKTMGADVLGYALAPPTEPSFFTAVKVGDNITHVEADIRDTEKMASELGKFKPEIVFHLAAQPLVLYSYDNPQETFSSNVMGTLNVLEAVRACASVEAVVNITSDKCYENKEWLWGYREGEPLGGYDPYSASKACAEILANSYRLSYFSEQGAPRLASVRAGNVIGGGDWGLDRLVPDMMTAFANNEQVVIRNPHAIRPWQHVLDALAGYLLLAERLYSAEGADYAEAWNFGPDRQSEQSVATIAQIAQKSWGDGAQLDISGQVSQLHEAHFLKLDSTKARTRLDWSPQWGLTSAIEQSVSWYRHFYQGNQETMADFSSQQIAEFSAGTTTSLDLQGRVNG